MICGIGIGIGLYLCKQILNELGGNLAIQSEQSKGTRCLIELPVSLRITTLSEGELVRKLCNILAG